MLSPSDLSPFFPAAPWSKLIKITSLLCTVIIPLFSLLVLAAPPGFWTRLPVRIAIFSIAPIFLLANYCWSVRGYILTSDKLIVRRPLFSTPIDLHDLRSVHRGPSLCEGSSRIFGNGGLYAFTGTWSSPALGRYEAYVTNFQDPVALKFSNQTVVISPESSQAFLEALERLHPIPAIPPVGP